MQGHFSMTTLGDLRQKVDQPTSCSRALSRNERPAPVLTPFPITGRNGLRFYARPDLRLGTHELVLAPLSRTRLDPGVHLMLKPADAVPPEPYRLRKLAHELELVDRRGAESRALPHIPNAEDTQRGRNYTSRHQLPFLEGNDRG